MVECEGPTYQPKAKPIPRLGERLKVEADENLTGKIYWALYIYFNTSIGDIDSI